MHGDGEGGGNLYRCPGDGCDLWEATAGDYEERKMVCLDCNKCKGKPPLLNQSNSPEEIKKRVIFRIESLINQENAGHLDKSYLEFWEWRLIEVWREKEIDYERIHKAKIAAIFEAMLNK